MFLLILFILFSSSTGLFYWEISLIEPVLVFFRVRDNLLSRLSYWRRALFISFLSWSSLSRTYLLSAATTFFLPCVRFYLSYLFDYIFERNQYYKIKKIIKPFRMSVNIKSIVKSKF